MTTGEEVEEVERTTDVEPKRQEYAFFHFLTKITRYATRNRRRTFSLQKEKL